MHSLIKKILSNEYFINKPITLLDIGASGYLNEEWELLSPYSFLILCEADNRDFNYKLRSKWKRIIKVDKIISAANASLQDFYLTQSPHCSSSLPPDNEALNNYAFSELFLVKEKKILSAVGVEQLLNNESIKYIDWFKSDSQGIDLRLFKALGENIYQKTLLAEFEPGLMDAYSGEDKLFDILKFMEKSFWISDCRIKGNQRIKKDLYYEYVSKNKIQDCRFTLKESPGWVNICYLNKMDNPFFEIREYLLMCVFAMIKEQYGFLLEIAANGEEKFKINLFTELKDYAIKKLNISDFKILSLKTLHRIKRLLLK